MSAPELMPCPFCGGGNIREHGDDKVVGYHCLKCEASGPNHYVTGMDWNTRAATGWQDISTAPKDGTWVIIGTTCDDGKEGRVFSNWFFEGDQWGGEDVTQCGAIFAGESITHWQPLPAPPVQS
jgi:hypothetical protein